MSKAQSKTGWPLFGLTATPTATGDHQWVWLDTPDGHTAGRSSNGDRPGDEPGYHGAFDELTRELQRAQAHNVVVPSLGHLAHHPILRDLMLTRLARDANAHVWVVAP